MRLTKRQRIIATLTAARNRLSKRGSWCQNHYALNRNGAPSHPWLSDAVRWCAHGAIEASKRRAIAKVCVTHLEKTLGVADLTCWNDRKGRTRRQVLDLFDRTIARLSAK